MTEEATSSDTSSSKCENQVILLGSADVGKTSLFYCMNGKPEKAKTSKPSPPIPNYCEPFIDYKGKKVQVSLTSIKAFMFKYMFLFLNLHDSFLTRKLSLRIIIEIMINLYRA